MSYTVIVQQMARMCSVFVKQDECKCGDG